MDKIKVGGLIALIAIVVIIIGLVYMGCTAQQTVAPYSATPTPTPSPETVMQFVKSAVDPYYDNVTWYPHLQTSGDSYYGTIESYNFYGFTENGTHRIDVCVVKYASSNKMYMTVFLIDGKVIQ